LLIFDKWLASKQNHHALLLFMCLTNKKLLILETVMATNPRMYSRTQKKQHGKNIYVIWQLKGADLKPFSVLEVNIVRLGLSFQAKTYGFVVVLLSLKLYIYLNFFVL
jgi:hypothetical protein